ncbi:MAG: 3' terminal RNA ribose 2'-O-methyltransferase Hen1 [Chloroflexi bacterium]|nr:3' terminal RNA ribose 2'-O-methyltransferase Hen1 [Chloroflexota bacterium]
MLLTITCIQTLGGEPATHLGYLLHKNPARVQSFDLPFGKAHVFYPVASEESCTAALLLDIDPVGLVRGHRGTSGEGQALTQYVNDRPYVASSFMSVAIGRVFGTAMSGKSQSHQEMADAMLPLQAKISALPCRSGEELLRKLFEPLGYEVSVQGYPLDEKFPEWGQSRVYTVELQGSVRLRDLLTHLYVLIPVLDDEKHYWVGEDEVEKLLRRGAGWLSAHPERQLITDRYLKHYRHLARAALARLAEEDQPDPDVEEEVHDLEEEVVEEKISLNQQRLGAVMSALKASGARRVLDLGCGEGRLLKLLLDDRSFTDIVGVDVSYRVLEKARDRLRIDRLPPRQAERIKLVQGSLTYRDSRLSGYDAAAVVEVIEHLDPPRLAACERVLFEFAKPGTVVMTTPNAEYNVKWESLPAGKFRHRDHRFEWTRAEFQNWAVGVAGRFGYSVRFLPVGPEDPVVGSPTQMALFEQLKDESDLPA